MKTETRPAGGVRTVSGAPRRPFFRRRKTCPFSGESALKIDYKDVKLLQRFISERGKIVPSRITAVSNKKQRLLANAIKRGAFMPLLPSAVSGGRRAHASNPARTRREARPDGRRGEGQGRLRPQLPAADQEG